MDFAPSRVDENVGSHNIYQEIKSFTSCLIGDSIEYDDVLKC